MGCWGLVISSYNGSWALPSWDLELMTSPLKGSRESKKLTTLGGVPWSKTWPNIDTNMDRKSPFGFRLFKMANNFTSTNIWIVWAKEVHWAPFWWFSKKTTYLSFPGWATLAQYQVCNSTWSSRSFQPLSSLIGSIYFWNGVLHSRSRFRSRALCDFS